MKSISINPQPFLNAQTRADWFKDPVAVADWDKTFAIIKKLGFTQVRYKINLMDTFLVEIGVSGASPNVSELWARRIDPILKYCAVYKIKLLLVMDDILSCVENWGKTVVVELLQRVIDRVGSRAQYTFDELDPTNWKSVVTLYSEIVNSIIFRSSIQAPPMLVTPFIPWQPALREFVASPLAKKYAKNSINIYVDRRFAPSHISVYSSMLTKAKAILTTVGKPYVIQETGLNYDYAQVDDISRGDMLLQLERTILKIGGFQDYGICCTHDSPWTPPNAQFSILNPNVLLGYLKTSGYSPSIVLPVQSNNTYSSE